MPPPQPADLQGFISALCTVDTSKRLSSKDGVSEVQSHPYFEGFDWTALEEGLMAPPIIPNPNDINAPSSKEIEAFKAPEGEWAGPPIWRRAELCEPCTCSHAIASAASGGHAIASGGCVIASAASGAVRLRAMRGLGAETTRHNDRWRARSDLTAHPRCLTRIGRCLTRIDRCLTRIDRCLTRIGRCLARLGATGAPQV